MQFPHLRAVRISLGDDLPSSASLRMTGYLAGFVGSTTPGGVAAAAITERLLIRQKNGGDKHRGRGTVACVRVSRTDVHIA